MRTLAVVSVAVLGAMSAACATGPKDPMAEFDAARIITCQAGPECDQTWSRAVTWVVSNTKMKVQIQTDDLLQTYESPNSADTRYTLARLSAGPARYQITLTAGCRHSLVCLPNPTRQKAAFYRAVTGQ